MSYLHLASTANSSTSSTPSSYLHVNSNGGVSTVPSSNSSSLLGSIGTGKQWTTIGQSSTSSSSSSSTLAQQLLMKQPNLLNVQSSTSSHFENLLASSSQTPMEKNVNNKFDRFSFRIRFHFSSNYNKKIFLHYRIEVILMSQHLHLQITFNHSIKLNIQHHQYQMDIIHLNNNNSNNIHNPNLLCRLKLRLIR